MKRSALRSLAKATVFLSGFALVNCDNANCESMRDDLYALKLSWQDCKSTDECQLVGGNGQDCTGIMSCNMAVNVKFVKEADRRIASLPEETVQCHKCGSPNCPEGELVYCEPHYHRCIVVKEFIDMGPPSSGFSSGGRPETGGQSATGGLGGSGGNSGTGGDGLQPPPVP
jgi:hypothetical protein